MRLTLADPYFAQKIIQKYFVSDAGSSEAVDFVYYDSRGQGMEQTLTQTHLLLQLFFRFQTVYAGKLVSGGNLRLMEQMVTHVLPGISVGTFARMRSVLKKMREEAVRVKEQSGQKAEVFFKESVSLLTFLKGRTDLLTERETWIRLAGESGGAKAASLMEQYFLDKEQQLSDGITSNDGVSEKELLPVLQKIVTDNRSQVSLLLQKAKDDPVYRAHASTEKKAEPEGEGPGHIDMEHSQHVTLRILSERSPKEFIRLLEQAGVTEIPEFQGILKEAGLPQSENTGSEEGILSYDTVTLLFRDTKSYRNEWEQLATLTGQRLGPEAERQLRREYERQIAEENYFLQEENHFSREVNYFPQEGNNQTSVENASPHATLRMLAERSPKEFTELLKEAGITAIPEFQEILKEAGQSQKKNIRGITAGIGAETDLLEKNTAAEVWSAEESTLLYDTVTLLFRDTDTHRKEWEQLAILIGQRLGPEAERQLRREYESQIVEENCFLQEENHFSRGVNHFPQEENNQTSLENASPHATLRMLAERSPKEFTELLKEAGITAIPNFQEILEEAGRLQKKNIREITAGIGAETDLLEKNTAAEIWSAEESLLLYDTVTLLFRDTDTHGKEWEQLAALTGQRLGPKAERQLRREYEGRIVEISSTTASNIQAEEKETPISAGVQELSQEGNNQTSVENAPHAPLRKLAERSPKEFTKLLKEAGITAIPEFQAILEEAGLPQKKNIRGITAGIGTETDLVEKNTAAEVWSAEESLLLYDTVTLLFRDTKSYRKEWEQLATLTGQRLGPEAERQLRREYESRIMKISSTMASNIQAVGKETPISAGVQELSQEGNNQTSVENAPHAPLRKLAERSPKEFTELLKEAGITAIPEFQGILEEAGRLQKKNIREITAGIGAETDLVEKNTAEEVWSAEESTLLYDTVTLLFRDTDTHRKEWEQLAILIGQRLGPEAEGQLRREYESRIVEISSTTASNIQAVGKETPIATGVQELSQEGNNQTSVARAPHATLRKLAERSPKEFTELLKESGITAIPEFQGILKESSQSQRESPLFYDTVSLLLRGEYGNRLNVIKGAGERSSVEEAGGNMPPSHLQLLQGKRQKGQEQEETRGRLQKLEEQIQIQQKEVIRLTEGQHTSMKASMPDVNALTRQVMQNLERELRLEKMRKGLL